MGYFEVEVFFPRAQTEVLVDEDDEGESFKELFGVRGFGLVLQDCSLHEEIGLRY